MRKASQRGRRYLMLLFALQESEGLGAGIAAALEIELSALEHRSFEDGEVKIRPLTSVRGTHVCVVQSLYGGAGFSVHDKLCRLLFLIATMRDHGATRVSAVVPYLAYGRKDRRTRPQDPLSTRYVVQMFEAVSCAGFDLAQQPQRIPATRWLTC